MTRSGGAGVLGDAPVDERHRGVRFNGVTVRLFLVSDTHLAPDAPEACSNWDAVVSHVASARPDAVVHLGDLTVDGANQVDHLAFARTELDRLPVPWYAVPGNHDVGDNAFSDSEPDNQVDAGRRQRWLDRIGPDRWRLDLDGWTLLGLDAQLLGTGLPSETDQWDWLVAQMATIDPAHCLALAVHKPAFGHHDEVTSSPAHRFLPAAVTARLEPVWAHHPPTLVISGHVHQHRVIDRAGTRHLWVPTTWAVIPDSRQPVFGHKICGLLSLRLDPGAPARADLIQPPNLRQLTLHHDVVSPYAAASARPSMAPLSMAPPPVAPAGPRY